MSVTFWFSLLFISICLSLQNEELTKVQSDIVVNNNDKAETESEIPFYSVDGETIVKTIHDFHAGTVTRTETDLNSLDTDVEDSQENKHDESIDSTQKTIPEEESATSGILQILLDILPLDVYAEKILSQIKNHSQDNSSSSESTPNTSTQLPTEPSQEGVIYGIPDSSIPSAIEATSLPPSSPLSILSNVRDKFNYASMDCGANVLSVNREAKEATSILVGSKDRYMLNPCGASKQFVVLELCEEIGIQILALANYEFFSSMFKSFEVFGTNRYPAQMWTPLGNFTAQNIRRLQYFVLPEPLWFKYIRIKFNSHYGDEHYCPISELRVHGTTVVDDITLQIERDSREISELANALRSPFRAYHPPPLPSHDIKPISSNYHPPIHRHNPEPDDDEDDPIDYNKDWDSIFTDTGNVLKGLEDTIKQSLQRFRNGIEDIKHHKADEGDHVDYPCHCNFEDGECACGLDEVSQAYRNSEISDHQSLNLNPTPPSIPPTKPTDSPESRNGLNGDQEKVPTSPISLEHDNTPQVKHDSTAPNPDESLTSKHQSQPTNTHRSDNVNVDDLHGHIDGSHTQNTGDVNDQPNTHHEEHGNPSKDVNEQNEHTTTQETMAKFNPVTGQVEIEKIDNKEPVVEVDKNETNSTANLNPPLVKGFGDWHESTMACSEIAELLSQCPLVDDVCYVNDTMIILRPYQYLLPLNNPTEPEKTQPEVDWNAKSQIDDDDDDDDDDGDESNTQKSPDNPSISSTPSIPTPESSPPILPSHKASVPGKSLNKEQEQSTEKYSNLGFALGSAPQNIFKTLITRIKTLEINQSIAAVYLADLQSSYAEAFSSMYHTFTRLDEANSDVIKLIQSTTKKSTEKHKILSKEVEELRAERIHMLSNISVLAREIRVLSETTIALQSHQEEQRWFDMIIAGLVGGLLVAVLWKSNNSSPTTDIVPKQKPRPPTSPVLRLSRSVGAGMNLIHPEAEKVRKRRRNSIGHSLSPSFRIRKQLSFPNEDDASSGSNSDLEMDADDEFSNTYFKKKEVESDDDVLASSSKKEGGGIKRIKERVLPYIMRKSASATTMDHKYEPDLLRFLFM